MTAAGAPAASGNGGLATAAAPNAQPRAPTMCDAPVAVSVGDISTLILLLQSSETPVLTTALESLNKFAEPDAKRRVTLLNAGLVDAVLKLLSRRSDDAIKQPAVACIAAATEVAPIHGDMKRKDLMEKMIQLLQNGESVHVQEEAAFTLANLAVDATNRASMRKNGALAALSKALRTQDPDVQKQAAFALSILLDDFANRSELRHVQGLADLLALLSSEYHEIKENAVQCLLKCTEDHGNRIELFKIGGLGKLVQALSAEPAHLYPGLLKCLANVLEHEGLAAQLSEVNGIAPLATLAASDDSASKVQAEAAIAVAARIERNRHYFREAGVLPLLLANLSHPSTPVVANACVSLASLARNDLNQTELIKLNVLDRLVRLLHASDAAEIKRATLVALTSCCLNVRMRIALRDHIGFIVKTLETSRSDHTLVIDTADCLSNLAEDALNRLEIVRHNGVGLLVQALAIPDCKVQAISALALARLLQDAEGRAALLEKQGMPRMIELLGSSDMSVQRNMAWAISSAAALETLAVQACGMGALESLMTIARDTTRAGTKFASDALEKLLNYHASAKYWMRNELSATNRVCEGFFDMGYVGAHVDVIPAFQTLAQLCDHPVDKGREVLAVNPSSDARLSELLRAAGTAVGRAEPTPAKSVSLLNMNDAAARGPAAPHPVVDAAVTQEKGAAAPASRPGALKRLADIVASAMGGVYDAHKVHEVPFKTKLASLKLQAGSNVIPLGAVDTGVWYHRALLFKTLCDNVDMPCALSRGSYNRAWNTVGIIKDELLQQYSAQPAALEELRNVLAGYSLGEEVSCIVDLMFEPGQLLAIGTRAANDYSRIQ